MEGGNVKSALQSFKIPYNTLGNLNISCDPLSSRIVLWSKYEIFTFSPPLRDIVRMDIQFEIEKVLVSRDCLLCLDFSGIMNLSTTESSLICSQQGIKCVTVCEIDNRQHVVSLQFEQNKSVLFVNKFDIDFVCLNELEIAIPNDDWKDPEGIKSIMASKLITREHLKKLIVSFNMEKSETILLVIVSLDRRNVYAILSPVVPPRAGSDFNRPQNFSQTVWVKLYNSFTEIVDIEITITDEIFILLGLSAGNVIKIPLLLRNRKPDVCHLNTAINKFVMTRDTIIYTDGLTMWKNENLFSKSDFKIEQFLVRNVRDFCLIGKKVYCITYSNVIYSFDIDHNTAYINPYNTDETHSVELVTNSDYLAEIMVLVQKNKDLLDKIDKESVYLMALSLSKRADIMDELIQVNASVFDNYFSLAEKYTDLTLTDELNAYYESNSYYFLIQMSVAKVQHKLNKLLSGMLGDIKVHITLQEQGLFKTTSIRIKEELTKKNFVLPLKAKSGNIRKLKVLIKIITSIPGKFSEAQKQWIILYRKCIVLHAENFINIKSSTSNIHLKEDEMPLDLLICKIANHLHGTQYKYISHNQKFEWTFHVKLPREKKLQMGNILSLIDQLDSRRTEVFRRHMPKFSKDKNWLEFCKGEDRVTVKIDGDTLKVTCLDIIIALDIRNFFSDIIFTSTKNKSCTEIVDHKLYTTIENLERDVKRIRGRSTQDKFAKLLTRFLWTVYCSIPI